jgi:hypothetical protein
VTSTIPLRGIAILATGVFAPEECCGDDDFFADWRMRQTSGQGQRLSPALPQAVRHESDPTGPAAFDFNL